MAEIMIRGIKVTDDDVVLDDFTPKGEYNPYNIHPFILHDECGCIAVVFAGNSQDALDIAADNGKMDNYLVDEDEDTNGDVYSVCCLGNSCESYNIEGLQITELENPPMSFCVLYGAFRETTQITRNPQETP